MGFVVGEVFDEYKQFVCGVALSTGELHEEFFSPLGQTEGKVD